LKDDTRNGQDALWLFVSAPGLDTSLNPPSPPRQLERLMHLGHDKQHQLCMNF
jgi:hypothetical protein